MLQWPREKDLKMLLDGDKNIENSSSRVVKMNQ